MEYNELFNGIAVIIDDEIDTTVSREKADINKLIATIEEKNIPCIKYRELPDFNVAKHFHNISFLLLDWNLHTGEMIIPDSIINENLSFLNEIIKECFFPIFIFTNEEPVYIKNILIENELYRDESPNLIFIERKKNLEEALFNSLDKWIHDTPSIYVLKEWEKEYNHAKVNLFNFLYEKHPSWPKYLWKTYKQDGANESYELGELITRNIETRMKPFNFNNEILSSDEEKLEISTEIGKSILEGQRFIKNDFLNSDIVFTGDIFKPNHEGDNNTYYLNIRPQCDIIRTRNPELYCLKGDIIEENMISFENKKESDTSSRYYICNGQFIPKSNEAIIPFIDGKIIRFKFRNIKIKKWNNMKEHRIGRLLPPYITSIQQRYGLYLQRIGLPRIPENIFNIQVDN